MLSPVQLRFDSWKTEWRNLTVLLDSRPSFRAALHDLRLYHELTEFLDENPADFIPKRRWRKDGLLSLLAFAIERRALRFGVKDRRKPPRGIVPVHGGCALALDNVPWQQGFRQFPYPKAINGNAYHVMPQVQSFAEEHHTLAAAKCELQEWRPSQTVLHRRVVDACTISALLGWMVLYNGDGAGDSIPEWFHLHGLLPPEDLPIQQAFALAGRTAGLVERIDEPFWPLPAYRITGSAEAIAGEVTKLALHCNEVAGSGATESMAFYPGNNAVVCIYVPRDRGREWVEEFGGKPGAFEVAAGCLVQSAPDRCARLRAGGISFEDLWEMLRGVRPGWANEL